MNSEEGEGVWFEEIIQEQDELGQDEVDGAGVGESCDQNLVINENSIEDIHHEIFPV